MSNDIEYQLIKKAIKGDVNSFETMVYQYEKKVYNIAYRMFGNEHDAYDASQEVFIKIYQKLDQFKFDSAFSTWLHRLATNTCIDLYRKRKRQTKDQFSIDKEIYTKESTVTFDIEDDKHTPEEKAVQNETVNEVRTAINQLKEDHKAVLILRDINQMSYQEVADILDVSVGTVKSRINRARNALKEKILAIREQNST